MFGSYALLLIGHGSARYPAAGDVIQHHAASLRQQGHFARVEVALLNGAPTVASALDLIGPLPIRVVPFFMEDGYFTRVAVPATLKDRTTIQCPPIGTHDGLAAILQRQAMAACAETGIQPEAAAVVIVGHGSAKAPGRALALHRHAAGLEGMGRFARVEAACLEEPPFVADVLASLRSHPTIVIGFFANKGGHVLDDVPALIAAEQAARGPAGLTVRFHGSLTDDPAMGQIILDQVRSVPGG